jgi:hypothetical protein
LYYVLRSTSTVRTSNKLRYSLLLHYGTVPYSATSSVPRFTVYTCITCIRVLYYLVRVRVHGTSTGTCTSTSTIMPGHYSTLLLTLLEYKYQVTSTRTHCAITIYSTSTAPNATLLEREKGEYKYYVHVQIHKSQCVPVNCSKTRTDLFYFGNLFST